MSDLRDWLRRNNFEQYTDTFEANDIDLDILPELSESDLEKLGLSLGNRRRLLKAIAGPGAPAPSRLSGPEGATSSDAERRQVTVLFSDMVGSTALSGKIDPELLGGLIRRYQDAAAGAIGRYGGFVAKFMGDGVLAYFGFPHAFEDAAGRAVRAAIDILAEVGGIELPDQTRIQTRVGIATGLVVVGEIIGTGSAQERTIVGETPNLAARLQALAGPDTILVSEFDPEFARRPVRTRTYRRTRIEGVCAPSTGLAREGRGVGGKPLCRDPRRTEPAADRPRPRNGFDARSLAHGSAERRPDRHGDRRSRDWKIALDRSAAGSACRRAACTHPSAMFTLSQGQRALSRHHNISTALRASPQLIRRTRGSKNSAPCSHSGRLRTRQRFHYWLSCCRSPMSRPSRHR